MEDFVVKIIRIGCFFFVMFVTFFFVGTERVNEIKSGKKKMLAMLTDHFVNIGIRCGFILCTVLVYIYIRLIIQNTVKD